MRIYIIEFQKRGLPHAHILVILRQEDKPSNEEGYSRFVLAELPNPDVNPLLYKTIVSSMMHGPCRDTNPNSPCMKNGKCSKKFPKGFAEATTIRNGYPVYMRRSRPEGELKHGPKTWNNKTVNQWVVWYNPYLAQKYNCHLNVEVCSTIKAVKCLYKDADKAMITVDGRRHSNLNNKEPDEIKRYIKAHYISLIEACQRLLDWPAQEKLHSVVYLTARCKGESDIGLNENANITARVEREESTTLTAYFNMYAADPTGAGTILCQDIPKKYRYDKKTCEWVRYKKFIPSTGRKVYCSLQNINRFYLRLMLCHRKGPPSFENLRTVNGVLYPTFNVAALAAGLLENDSEWRWCMAEAATFRMPHQLRLLFVTILMCSLPSDARGLWDSSFDDMSRDFQYIYNVEQANQMVRYKTLYSADMLLRANRKSLADFDSLPSLEEPDELRGEGLINRMVEKESSAYSTAVLRRILDIMQIHSMNENQRYIFNQVIQAVNHPETDKKLLFINEPGGTGKSFVLEQILATLRVEGKIALAVAFSGIAATLLMAPMTRRFSFEVVDRTLRDLMDNKHEPFGGKVIMLSDNFRLILPVVKCGGIADTISACLKPSPLWPMFQQLHLKTNMRGLIARNQQEGAGLAAFSTLLLQVGEGLHKRNSSLADEHMKIPRDLVIAEPEEVADPDPLEEDEDEVEEQSDLTRLVTSISSELNSQTNSDAYFAERSTNSEVYRIDEEVTKRLYSAAKEYLSVDAVQEGTDEGGWHETEFLNSLSISGIPPRRISHVFVPRIMFISNEGDFPFQLHRKRFLAVPAFAMTINKAQAQSLHHMGLYLPGPVFAHGQLYVTLSKVTSRASIKITVAHPVLKEADGVYTKNVVYSQIFDH